MVIGQLSYGIMEYVPNEQTTKKGTPMNRRKYIQAAADIIHSIQTDSYYFHLDIFVFPDPRLDKQQQKL